MHQRIFREKAWYIERQEREEHFAGIIESLTPASGPANRPSLSFVLRRLGQPDLPIYAAEIESILKKFVGRKVSIVGKQIDFQQQRFSTELWIGEIFTENEK